MIEELRFECIVGILEEERNKEQEVVSHVQIQYEKTSKDFINYAEIAQLIESIMIEEKFELLEEALDVLVSKIKREFQQIKSIRLKISKPSILDNCVVGVELFKEY
jgi:dihydroneopterin aldolase